MVGPIRFWVFLDGRRFAANALSLRRWISLDFLGFSRPNRDFSMDYADFSPKEFSRALPRVRSPERERSVWPMRRLAGASDELEMGVILDQLLFTEIVSSHSVMGKKMFTFLKLS
jgi:hypothetical protein